MGAPKIFIVDGLRICKLCLDGQGGICHVPGCSLIRSTALDIPIREAIECNGGTIREEGSSAWQPIGTAPKDGTAILAFGWGAITSIYWDGDDWCDCEDDERWAATHWMPLPEPPIEWSQQNDLPDESR